MPKVKMLVKISGSRDGEDWPGIGEELTCSKQEAEDLVAQGNAEKVTAPKKQ